MLFAAFHVLHLWSYFKYLVFFEESSGAPGLQTLHSKTSEQERESTDSVLAALSGDLVTHNI